MYSGARTTGKKALTEQLMGVVDGAAHALSELGATERSDEDSAYQEEQPTCIKDYFPLHDDFE